MFALLFALILLAQGAQPDVADLIKRTEQQSLGKTFRGRLRMSVMRAEGPRELEIQSWTEGKEKAMVKVLKPAKDRGTANLRIDFNLWQYLPKIERTIKVPPSLMLQSWMGSDFTNDDLVKATRLSRDYNCKFEAEETLNSLKVTRLNCLPKPDAPVVWGKMMLWIESKRAVLVRQEFFSENGEKLKEMVGSDIKNFGGHHLASKLTMTTLKKNTVTVLEQLEAEFDKSIEAKTFTPAFLQAPIKE